MDKKWIAQFRHFIEQDNAIDAGHDIGHILRVVANAKWIGRREGAEMSVVIPAAWLHDCVSVPKDSPLRSRASRMAAERAGAFLREIGYSEHWIGEIEHAIETHSFSANITPRTLEAKVVQDADRLEALGAIGIARVFITGSKMGIPLLDADEPLPKTRTPQDGISMIDHFYTKLLKLADTMRTTAGKEEAMRRSRFMERYLDQLAAEVVA